MGNKIITWALLRVCQNVHNLIYTIINHFIDYIRKPVKLMLLINKLIFIIMVNRVRMFTKKINNVKICIDTLSIFAVV